MNTDQSDLALDADGIPILTDLVSGDKPEGAPAGTTAVAFAPPTAENITSELLASASVSQQLDQMADNLTRDMRLNIEQTLSVAIDEAVNQVLEKNHARIHDSIRRQLDVALAEIISEALQDHDPVF